MSVASSGTKGIAAQAHPDPMLAFRIARARRLNAAVADRPATVAELTRAVRAWEKLHADAPDAWWVRMGLGEALFRRGNRTHAIPDLERALALFEAARAQDDRPLARMGGALCHAGIGLCRDEPAALRESLAHVARLREAADTPLDMVAAILLVEAQNAARLARLTHEPADERRARQLQEHACGMIEGAGLTPAAGRSARTIPP